MRDAPSQSWRAGERCVEDHLERVVRANSAFTSRRQVQGWVARLASHATHWLQVPDAEIATIRRKAMPAGLRTQTSRSPGKRGCQEKASSVDDSTCAGCCETAELLQERERPRQIGTSGRSCKHLRRLKRARAPKKEIEGGIQCSGISTMFSTVTKFSGH